MLPNEGKNKKEQTKNQNKILNFLFNNLKQNKPAITGSNELTCDKSPSI